MVPNCRAGRGNSGCNRVCSCGTGGPEPSLSPLSLETHCTSHIDPHVQSCMHHRTHVPLLHTHVTDAAGGDAGTPPGRASAGSVQVYVPVVAPPAFQGPGASHVPWPPQQPPVAGGRAMTARGKTCLLLAGFYCCSAPSSDRRLCLSCYVDRGARSGGAGWVGAPPRDTRCVDWTNHPPARSMSGARHARCSGPPPPPPEQRRHWRPASRCLLLRRWPSGPLRAPSPQTRSKPQPTLIQAGRTEDVGREMCVV